jgi:hypothetical protein
VLLFAVTTSVVGIFANFAPNLIASLTQGTRQQAESQIECEGAGVAFEGVNYNGTVSPARATYVLRNTGNQNLLDVSVVSFSDRNIVIEQTSDVEVYTGNLTSVVQTGLSRPAYVKAFSGRCGSVEAREDL